MVKWGTMSVIVRFPPSPTGPLHLGGARTALFNYLFAKQNGGKIFLRLEDTDRARSKSEFAENILESLKWLGLEFDNKEPIRQSERSNLYKDTLEKLISGGAAYISKETTGDRAEVIRLKNPGRKIVFRDLIRGEITFDTAELGDFVIAKSLAEPLYHLAVVVDDLELGVTHVIRGEDHISNTPRQLLLIEALSGKAPLYAHIPLILAPDRSKLSKRYGAVSTLAYRDEGYLPEALVNYLALLGWNPGTDREIFSLLELVKEFNLSKVQKGGAIFNQDKLNWLNREYLKNLPQDKWSTWLPGDADHEMFLKILPILKERINVLSELKNLTTKEGEFGYFFQTPKPSKELLGDVAPLKEVVGLLSGLMATNFTMENVKGAVFPLADRLGRKEVLWPLRLALSGKERSPDPFTIAGILGKEEVLKRLENALKISEK